MQTPENQTPHALIDFNVISEATELFKVNAATWIISLLIVAVVDIILYGILMATSIVLMKRAAVAVPGILLIDVIFLVVNALLAAGLFRMAIKQIRGQSIEISDLFDFGDVAGQAIIAAIVAGIIISVASLFCIIPGWVAQGLLMFTFPLIVDKKMGAMEAITASFEALKSQWLMATLFSLVVGILASIGIIVCFVGVLVTAPIALLSITILYRNFFISPGSSSSGDQTFEPAIPPGS